MCLGPLLTPPNVANELQALAAKRSAPMTFGAAEAWTQFGMDGPDLRPHLAVTVGAAEDEALARRPACHVELR